MLDGLSSAATEGYHGQRIPHRRPSVKQCQARPATGAPAGGGQDVHALLHLGGSPVVLGADATRASQAMSVPTCCLLFALRLTTATGNTDLLCGIPGVSTVGGAVER